MTVVKLTAENFSEVVTGDKPVFVDFYADWCGPCNVMSPIVEKLAESRPDIVVGKVDVDADPEIAQKLNIQGIPTFAGFNNSEEPTFSFVGSMPLAALEDMLDNGFKAEE